MKKNKVIVVIPVYNEEKVLESSIRNIYNYMDKNIKEDWNIIIANNASIDNTKEIADNLTKKFNKVRAVHLSFKGRGNALKYAWSKNKSDVYAYCDVDLATDISHLKELFDSILKGNNVVTGSRYLNKSKSKRTINRFVFSKGYIYLIKLFFKTQLNDFQCGFKAVDNKIVKEILPKVRNKEWFFDTELLLLAEQSGKYKIKQIPVAWKESKDTKVKIFKTVYDYVKNLIKLKRRL
jgi:glycosyltransferase involved in cell wall biosynthesis